MGRAAWMAATLAALALPASLALRDLIWRGLGLGTHVSSLPQLTAVLATTSWSYWSCPSSEPCSPGIPPRVPHPPDVAVHHVTVDLVGEGDLSRMHPGSVVLGRTVQLCGAHQLVRGSDAPAPGEQAWVWR